MIINLYHLVYSIISFGIAFLLIYVGFRRNFGHQVLSRDSLKLRIIILITLAALLLYPGDGLSLFLFILLPEGLLLCIVGLSIGMYFAVRTAKHMRFEKRGGALYYTPHTYIGMIIATFFLSSILYHAVLLSYYMLYLPSMYVNGVNPSYFDALFAFDKDLVTRFIFFVTIGYYLYYYSYALWKSTKLKP